MPIGWLSNKFADFFTIRRLKDKTPAEIKEIQEKGNGLKQIVSPVTDFVKSLSVPLILTIVALFIGFLIIKKVFK